MIPSSPLYIIIKIIYSCSLLLFALIALIFLLQHVISTNCSKGNSHILNSWTRRGQGNGCGHGRNPRYNGYYGNNSSNSHKMKASLHHQKWNNTEAKQENGKRLQDKPPKNHGNNCYKCGMKGHWSRTYRTLKHLVDLY